MSTAPAEKTTSFRPRTALCQKEARKSNSIHYFEMPADFLKDGDSILVLQLESYLVRLYYNNKTRPV